MSETPKSLSLRTCVSPEGRFIFGLHKPAFSAANLRLHDTVLSLGRTPEGQAVLNEANFPQGDVDEPGADPIYEIANPFPFRGTTYIGKSWADRTAEDPARISIPERQGVSLSQLLREVFGAEAKSAEKTAQLFNCLPRPLQLATAALSSDPEDLVRLAGLACEFERDAFSGAPVGLYFKADRSGRLQPKIHDQQLFDTVANNPNLPDLYKQLMVLRPGVQGQSEIVGEWEHGQSHIFEYLRRNSYIPWGHYAANLAHDAVRYAAGALTDADMRGLRHLYYQRTFVRVAQMLNLQAPAERRTLSANELEQLRRDLSAELKTAGNLPFSATLWGWNYGFDYAPSGYRLHASHQQIHQQYALIPTSVPAEGGELLRAYACGDLVQELIQEYRRQTGKAFFDCYLQAIAANQRMDGRSDRPADLVVHQDERVLLFVPKAQTSQWELQLMTRSDIGNILEADEPTRRSLDAAMLLAMHILTGLGAAMITVVEYSKRFQASAGGQRLLYTFLPRLPESPGAFSEAQLRWINGHYPEDFAQACRLKARTLS